MQSSTDLIPISDAAELLSCSRERLHELIRLGLLEAHPLEDQPDRSGRRRRRLLHVSRQAILERKQQLSQEADLDVYVPYKVAQEHIGVSQSMVSRLIKQGRLATVLVHRRFKHVSIESLNRECERRGIPQYQP